MGFPGLTFFYHVLPNLPPRPEVLSNISSTTSGKIVESGEAGQEGGGRWASEVIPNSPLNGLPPRATSPPIQCIGYTYPTH